MAARKASQLQEIPTGSEWVVDAYACRPASLRAVPTLQALFGRIVDDLCLHPVAEPIWRVFPETGGISGMQLLSESHLTCHTFPERGLATFNLYCCCERKPWAWEAQLSKMIGARKTVVTVLDRGAGPAPAISGRGPARKQHPATSADR